MAIAPSVQPVMLLYLEPRLADPKAFVFSPRDTMLALREIRRENRRTKTSPRQKARQPSVAD